MFPVHSMSACLSNHSQPPETIDRVRQSMIILVHTFSYPGEGYFDHLL